MRPDYDSTFFEGATEAQLLESAHPCLFDGSKRALVLEHWPRHPGAVRSAILSLLPIGAGIRPEMPWPGLAQRTLLETLERVADEVRVETLGALEGRLWTATLEREVARRRGESPSADQAALDEGGAQVLRTSADPSARKQQAIGLGQRGAGEDVLREALARDPDRQVRAACAAALGHLHLADLVDPLIGGLADDDPYCRDAAFVGLSVLGDERAIGPLLTAWLAARQPNITHAHSLWPLTSAFRATGLSGLRALLDRIEEEPKLAASDRVRFYVASAALQREPIQGELVRRLSGTPAEETLLARGSLYLRFVADHAVSPILERAIVTVVHDALPHLASGGGRTRAEKQFVKLATKPVPRR